MLRPDLVSRVMKAHQKAITAAGRWSLAAAKGRSTERPYAAYERAEARFDAAVAALVDDGQRKRR